MAGPGPITRRAALRGLFALSGAALAASAPGRALGAVSCPNACRSAIDADDAWIRGLPIIDAHCHVFNARDIPAARFITKVFLPSYSTVLKEQSQRQIEREIGAYVGETLSRTSGYALERAVLEARLTGKPPSAIDAAPPLPTFARGSATSCFGRDLAQNITAYRNLVHIMTGFRHQIFEALVATYETGLPQVGVALFTPAMIDMAYWLGPDPERPRPVSDVGTGAAVAQQTSIAQQVELMELTQRLYPGRCHTFVSFCPWRQVDDVASGRAPTALDLVRDAILNRGFAGVKLYPPMGFLPLGNSALPIGAFPPWAAKKSYAVGFGAGLDEALLALYRFCAEHEVPVMTHCAPTNGAGVVEDANGRRESYAERADPKGWARVLAEPGLSGLRLNLAHFGAGYDARETAQWRAVIGEMMDRYEHVYADLSYYPSLLLDNFTGSGQHCREAAEILEPLRTGFLARPAGDKRVRRLLYGSDWSMLSREFYYADYLAVAAHMYRRKIYGVGGGAVRNARAFLCSNAVRFLGLRKGEKTRERLEAWYAKHGLDAGVLARFDAVEA